MESVAYSLHIEGKVQGVFYRASTKRKADELGVKGWVQNERDGSVSAWIEGPRAQVDEMIAWCRQGPPFAVVKQVAQQQESVSGFVDFEIKY
jgi:acylphosphatase